MTTATQAAVLFLVFGMIIVAPHVQWPTAQVMALVCIAVSVLFYVIGLLR